MNDFKFLFMMQFWINEKPLFWCGKYYRLMLYRASCRQKAVNYYSFENTSYKYERPLTTIEMKIKYKLARSKADFVFLVTM